MSDLRTAAKQALEVLEQLQGGCTDSDDGTVEAITVWCPEVISDLRAALENDAVARDREEQSPLPKTEYTLASGFAVSRMPGYTADQMRAYASAAVAAERDRRSSAGHFRGAGMTPLLPYDTARCRGTDHAICQLCRRREPGHPQWQVTMAPPIDKATGECGMFIEPINDKIIGARGASDGAPS